MLDKYLVDQLKINNFDSIPINLTIIEFQFWNHVASELDLWGLVFGTKWEPPPSCNIENNRTQGFIPNVLINNHWT
jgi:hypothetical protein